MSSFDKESLNPKGNGNSYVAEFSDEKPPVKKRKIFFWLLGIFLTIAGFLTVILVCVFLLKKKKDDGIEFIYINDIHVDPLYIPNSRTSTRCRQSDPSVPSYVFGQYGCDSPFSTFESMLDFLPSVSSKPNFILFGGDAPAHSLGYNREQVAELIEDVVTNITATYNNEVPLLYVLGNNEFVPNYGNDDFSEDEENFQSLSNALRSILNEEQLETFRKGGYYYTDFPDVKLRFLVLNTIIYNLDREERDDPYGQFEWIENVSQEAIDNGYTVGVALHIPPGCTYSTGNNTKLNQGWLESYMKRYDEIVKKYNIVFSIAGHSHYDMILPLYGQDGISQGYSMSAPSISPQHNNNPAFRIFKYANGQILDYKQYYTDIMLNPQEKLEWQLEYTFKDAYNVSDASSGSLKNIATWVATTGEGRWRYKERVCSRAADNGLFYYCILTSTTEMQIHKCLGMKSLKSTDRRNLARYFPYGGK